MTVHKADLEAKLREIEGVVTDVEEEARSKILALGAVVGAVLIGLVVLAVWRSRRGKIRVEVYTL